TTPPSTPFFYFIRAYNRRFARMAQARRARGALARTNDCRRFLFSGYTFSPTSSKPLLSALLQWGRLELAEGWRSWFRRPAGTGNEIQADATPPVLEAASSRPSPSLHSH